MKRRSPRLGQSPGAAGPVLAIRSGPLGTTWRDFAACEGINVAMFFPGGGDDGDDDTRASAADVNAAKRVCRQCKIRLLCLEDALSYPRDRDYGVLGGTTREERERIREQRRRQVAA